MNLIAETVSLPERYTLSPSALQLREEMLITAQAVAAVSCAAEQTAAAEVGATLHRRIKDVQVTRLALSAPLDAAKSKLIEIERDYLAPLIAEKDRIGRLVTAYQVAESHRIAEEQRVRQEEINRLEKLRLEAAAKADRARTEKNQMKHELASYQADQAAQELIRAPLPAPVKARGVVSRKPELKWEVTDIKALYAARPELCRIEENVSAIKAVCDVNSKIPGIRFWEEYAPASFRS